MVQPNCTDFNLSVFFRFQGAVYCTSIVRALGWPIEYIHPNSDIKLRSHFRSVYGCCNIQYPSMSTSAHSLAFSFKICKYTLRLTILGSKTKFETQHQNIIIMLPRDVYFHDELTCFNLFFVAIDKRFSSVHKTLRQNSNSFTLYFRAKTNFNFCVFVGYIYGGFEYIRNHISFLDIVCPLSCFPNISGDSLAMFATVWLGCRTNSLTDHLLHQSSIFVLSFSLFF